MKMVMGKLNGFLTGQYEAYNNQLNFHVIDKKKSELFRLKIKDTNYYSLGYAPG